MVHITEFWHHVTQKIEPSGKQPTSLATDHIPVDNMTRRDATGDNEFISKCHDYIEQEANAKLFESAKADLKAMVGTRGSILRPSHHQARQTWRITHQCKGELRCKRLQKH